MLGMSAALPVNAQMAMNKAAASMPAEYTSGEVRKIDKDNGKVLLKHEEIKNLGMAPMAMMFDVKDRAMLGKVKEGDKVHFKAVYDSGKYVLVDIQPRK